MWGDNLPSVYDLKPAFQALLRPAVKYLARKGITANQITVAAVILSLVNGLLITLFPSASWPLFFLPFVLFLRMALNAIDGMLAREHAQQSALGGILNELGDVLSDSVLYLPFALVPPTSALLVTCIVLLAVISEMTGVVSVQIGAKRQYQGPMGKSDRAFWFGLLALLMASGFRNSFFINLLLVVILLLLILTIYNRSSAALKEVRHDT